MKGTYVVNILKDTWILQALAVCGSMLLLGVLVALLIYFDNKPVFDWNGITLNAIMALVATILKALVAFTVSECLGQAKWIWFSRQQRPVRDLARIDEASRGPLGSVKILWTPVARSFVSFGAMIVILSTAMDPFVQLTVGKSNMVIYANDSSAQISYARRYSKNSIVNRFPDPEGANPTIANISIARADFAMQSAIYNGLTRQNSWVTRETKYSCPSGNCTWDIFQSLAVCSACVDRTDRLLRSSFLGSQPMQQELFRTSNRTNYHLTEYWIPDVLRLNNEDGVQSTTLMSANGTATRNESLYFGSKDTFIWSMSFINVTDPEALWPNSPVAAVECGLRYCVNSYNSMIKNGSLIETFDPAPSTISPDSWQMIREGATEEGLKNRPTEGLAAPESVRVLRTDLQLGAGFNLTQGVVASISSLLRSVFLSGNRTPALVVKYDDPFYLPEVMQTLYQSQDLNATFATLAKSMTNCMRQDSDGNLVANGKLGTFHSLIQVHWGFFVLPAIMVLASAVFFALVIYYTHKTGIAILCSHVLPSVAFGRTVGPLFDHVRLPREMEEVAKSQKVQFSGSTKNSNSPEALSSREDDDDLEMASSQGGPQTQNHTPDEAMRIDPPSIIEPLVEEEADVQVHRAHTL